MYYDVVAKSVTCFLRMRVLLCHPAIRFKETSERLVFFFLPSTLVVEFCYSLGLGTTADRGDFWDSVDFLIVASLQTSGIWFTHASLMFSSRVCPLLRLLSPGQTRWARYTSVIVTPWWDCPDHTNKGRWRLVTRESDQIMTERNYIIKISKKGILSLITDWELSNVLKNFVECRKSIYLDLEVCSLSLNIFVLPSTRIALIP